MQAHDQQQSFGQWLRRRRKALDLTQAELAAQVPCAKGTIRRIESDDLRPSKLLAERLAQVLKVSTADQAAFVQAARMGQIDSLPSALRSIHQAASTAPHQRRYRVLPPPHIPIGRQHTIHVAAELLSQTAVRMVTLTGPPGVGKTLLARAIGQQQQSQFRDGACLVELAPLSSADHVLAAIAHTIELSDTGTPLEQALADRLRDAELLIILDNMEHVVDAAPALARLLLYAPAIKLLCTSRVPLRISSEHEFIVPPLMLPHQSQFSSPDQLAENPAVALFLARARSILPHWEATPEQFIDIAAICCRLDGLPLAIELAANRIKIFPPAALLTRLERRLPLLTQSTRDAPMRQRTLEAAINWSYDLLTPAEQTCLAHLSVFWGGATLTAIEGICPPDPQLLSQITALVDHSLLQAATTTPSDQDVRFSMLETIREFAALRLTERDPVGHMRTRHAQFFLNLARTAHTGLQGADQVSWMQRMNDEQNNLRAAFAWCVSEQGDRVLGLEACAGLWWFWWTSGQVGEGRRWLEALMIAAVDLNETVPYGYAALGAGILAFFAGDLGEAQPLFDRAYQIGRNAHDLILQGYTTFMIGTMHVLTGQPQEGYQWLDNGINLLAQAGEKAIWYYGVTNLASTLLILQRGDLDTAQRHAERGMAVFHQLGQPYGIGLAWNYLGDVARMRGEYAHAAQCYRLALDLLHSAHANSEIPAVLHNLAHVMLAQGDHWQAYDLFGTAFELHHAIGNRMGMIECLNGFAATLLCLNDHQHATLLLGSIDAMLEGSSAPLFSTEQVIYNQTKTTCTQVLSPPAWQQHYQNGRSQAPTEAFRTIQQTYAALAKVAVKR
ncbi:MAG: helix-turn-helix domain-containing protein [Roseiflexaceae bacterium]